MPESSDTKKTRFRIPSPAKSSVVVVSSLIVSLLVAGWCWHQNARTAIRTIEAAGGYVLGGTQLKVWCLTNAPALMMSNSMNWVENCIDWTNSDADITAVYLKNTDADPTIVTALGRCTNLRTLTIDGKSLGMEAKVLDQLSGLWKLEICGQLDAAHLAGLRNNQTIQRLEFSSLLAKSSREPPNFASISAESLDQLQYLPNLRSIYFRAVTLESPFPPSVKKLTKLTDIYYQFDGLQIITLPKDVWINLKHLPRLDEFTLCYGTFSTDAALEEASKLDGLTMLEVGGNGEKGFTDAGLVHLARLKSLKQATLWGHHITAAGIAQLRAALPHCQFDIPGSDNAEAESTR